MGVIKETMDVISRTNLKAESFFASRLHQQVDYIRERLKHPDICDIFHIGFAPNHYDLIHNNIDTDINTVMQCGLISVNHQNVPYNLFYNRIMFPLHDVIGNTVGFTGRSIGVANKHKYVNTPRSSRFIKGEHFFGIHESMTAIAEKRKVIVVEGNFDVLAMHSIGLCNTIATCGTSVTRQQCALLALMMVDVYVMFDGDQSGVRSAQSFAEKGKKFGMNIKICDLPQSADPADLHFAQGSVIMESLRKEGYEKRL